MKFCVGDLVIHKYTKMLGKIVPKENTTKSWSTEYMASIRSDAVWVSWGKDIATDGPNFSKAKVAFTVELELVKLDETNEIV
jgi:hypothetical protein